MLDAFCFATQLFSFCTDREFNPDPKTLDGLCLMALFNLTSTGGMTQPALYQLLERQPQALITMIWRAS